MADKAISELVAAERIKSTDMFVLEQDGTAKRLQGQTLLNWLTAAADGHGGISNIAKTSTSGLVDTYTITLADTTTKTFSVTNGNGITAFEKLSTVGLVDTYQFTRTDGTYFTFAVSNGAKGDTGDASHVWIKYASQQPTADSHSIGDVPDDWMGIYSGTAETAPTDWQAYAWYQIKGDKGDTGAPATVTGVTAEYIVSDSGTIVPSGSWSATIPSVPQGKYLWTRSTTTFNTGSPAVSYSVARMGIDGSGSVSSVNDKSPSGSGNVTLTADDIQTSGNASVQDELDNAVKYNTPQTLTAAQQAQARENINAPAPYTAGENISISGSVIATKAFPCNPNLLDNWYFGNPVDQRNGHIVPAGTPYFVQGSSTQSGVLSSPATVIGYLNSGGLYPQIKVGGETYITPIGTDIAGYAGIGYTIDRWKLTNNSGNIVLDDTGIMFTGLNNYAEFEQRYEFPENLGGKECTASILVDSFSGEGAFVLVIQNRNDYLTLQLSTGLNTFTFTFWSDSTELRFFVQSQNVNESNPPKIHILADKLELGSEQTLAHQENGVWVLNEIPDYGEQLRRCQRYAIRLSGDSSWSIVGIAKCDGSNNAVLAFWLPVPMRMIPSIVASGLVVNAVAVTSITTDQYNPTCFKCNGTLATNVPAGIYVIEQNGSGYVDVSADL